MTLLGGAERAFGFQFLEIGAQRFVEQFLFGAALFFDLPAHVEQIDEHADL